MNLTDNNILHYYTSISQYGNIWEHHLPLFFQCSGNMGSIVDSLATAGANGQIAVLWIMPSVGDPDVFGTAAADFSF